MFYLIELGVSAIKGTYKGYAEITDMEVLKSYSLQMVAEGPTGTVDAVAHIQLEEQDVDTNAFYSGANWGSYAQKPE